MTYIVRGVPAAAIDHLWKHAEAFVKRALDHANGEFTHDDIREFCEDSLMQLWLVLDEDKRVIAAASTEIINYRQKRVLRVVTLGGKKFEEWAVDLRDTLEDFAGRQGCHGLECYARKGFVNKLKNIGFADKYVMLYKDI